MLHFVQTLNSTSHSFHFHHLGMCYNSRELCDFYVSWSDMIICILMRLKMQISFLRSISFFCTKTIARFNENMSLACHVPYTIMLRRLLLHRRPYLDSHFPLWFLVFEVPSAASLDELRLLSLLFNARISLVIWHHSEVFRFYIGYAFTK